MPDFRKASIPSILDARAGTSMSGLRPAERPLCADFVEKLENVADTKTSPTKAVGCFIRCEPPPGGYEGPWSIFCESMWSLGSLRSGRTSGA
jgi:hypothetical protein